MPTTVGRSASAAPRVVRPPTERAIDMTDDELAAIASRATLRVIK